MIHSALYSLIARVRRLVHFLVTWATRIMFFYVVVLIGTMYAAGHSFSDFRLYAVPIGYAVFYLFVGAVIDRGLAMLMQRVALSYQRSH